MAEQVDTLEVQAVPRARRPRRYVVGVLVALVVLVVVPAGFALYAALHLSSNLTRLDGVFDGLSDRPAVPASAAGATNILVVGTDRGTDLAATDAAVTDLARQAGRSDTLMLVHIGADRRAASVISIPRDTVVDLPGHGPDRISAAFAIGGPSLGVETVEHLTGVHIDHVAVIDWSRFGALVDAIGGISIDVPDTTVDPASGMTWAAGRQVLDGREAVAYVRQSEGLARGDLDRITRQHDVLRAVMADALAQEMRKNPVLLYGFLDTLTERLAVDSGWSESQMGSLAFSMRDFRSANIGYLTMPVVATRDGSGAETFRPDAEASPALWQAVAEDRLAQWAADHPGART